MLYIKRIVGNSFKLLLKDFCTLWTHYAAHVELEVFLSTVPTNTYRFFSSSEEDDAGRINSKDKVILADAAPVIPSQLLYLGLRPEHKGQLV
jgi:hypothetical protein